MKKWILIGLAGPGLLLGLALSGNTAFSYERASCRRFRTRFAPRIASVSLSSCVVFPERGPTEGKPPKVVKLSGGRSVFVHLPSGAFVKVDFTVSK